MASWILIGIGLSYNHKGTVIVFNNFYSTRTMHFSCFKTMHKICKNIRVVAADDASEVGLPPSSCLCLLLRRRGVNGEDMTICL